MKLRQIGKVKWINLYRPGQKEVDALGQTYDLPPALFKDLLKPSPRPCLLKHGPYLLLILHFPIFDEQKNKVVRHEVDFLLGNQFLITAHWSPMPPIQEFHQQLAPKHKRQNPPVFSAPALLSQILSYFYQFLLRQLNHIQQDLEWLENNLFTKIDRQMIKTISGVRNNITSFQQHIYNQDEILKELSSQLNQKNLSASGFQLKPVLRKFNDIRSTLGQYSRTISTLHQTQDSLLNVKINEIILFLTIITTLAIPFGLIGLLPGPDTKSFGLLAAAVVDLVFLWIIYKKQWL